ncbi:MAG: right-handed parallel beta-helix repeat-containing protein [Phycisphaerae bacterium]|nr:right-handed parallel beta-helix repeat-containing protein [Phycisphaerae bacterium]
MNCRTNLVFTLHVVLTVGIAMAWPTWVEATAPTYYISPTGDDGTGDGSENDPWATLAYACSQIPTDGGRIICFEGNYVVSEQASVFLDPGLQPEFRLELHADANTHAVFDANDALSGAAILKVEHQEDPNTEPNSPADYGVQECTITGLAADRRLIFRNNDGDGQEYRRLLWLDFIGSRTVKWCDLCDSRDELLTTKNQPTSFYEQGGEGGWDANMIAEIPDSNVVIENCIFHTTAGLNVDGVVIDDAGDRPTVATVTSCEFYDICHYDSDAYSAALTGTCRLTVTDCYFHGNQFDYIDHVGVATREGGPPEFINCVFEDASFYNLWLCSNAVVRSCDFLDNDDAYANILCSPSMDGCFGEDWSPEDGNFVIEQCRFNGTTGRFIESVWSHVASFMDGWAMTVTLERSYFIGTFSGPILSTYGVSDANYADPNYSADTTFKATACVFRAFDSIPVSDGNAKGILLDNCTIAQGEYGLLFGDSVDDPNDVTIRNTVVHGDTYAIRAEDGAKYPNDFVVSHNMYLGDLVAVGTGSEAELGPNDLQTNDPNEVGLYILYENNDSNDPFPAYKPVQGGACTGTGTTDSTSEVSYDGYTWRTYDDQLIDRGAYCYTGCGSSLVQSMVMTLGFVGLLALRRRP